MQKHGFKKVMSATDILVVAFGAMIGWGWVVSSGRWIQNAGVIGTVIGALAGLAAGAIATGIAIHAENKAFNELEASHGKYRDEYENYVKQLKYEEEAAKQVKIQRETTALQTTD